METTQQTAEQIIKDIENGTPYLFESPKEKGKIWKIRINVNKLYFVISNNRNSFSRGISKKRAQQTIETHINKTL